MTVTVFTCMLGKTDTLRPPAMVNKRVRYVCFIDSRLTFRPVSPYAFVTIDVPPDGERRIELLARQLKIQASHPELGDPDVILWHDAANQLRCEPASLAAQYLNGYDMVAFKHPHRTRIEDEAVVIGRLGYMHTDVMTKQIATYRLAGWTDQQAITSTGFCLRKNTPQVRAFNEAWWQEVATWGWRDQMSVDYAIWKTGIAVGYIPGHYRDNPFAIWRHQS